MNINDKAVVFLSGTLKKPMEKSDLREFLSLILALHFARRKNTSTFPPFEWSVCEVPEKALNDTRYATSHLTRHSAQRDYDCVTRSFQVRSIKTVGILFSNESKEIPRARET